MYSATSKLKRVGIAGLTALVVLASVAGAASAQSYPDAANKALAWMKTQQQPDGSFAGFGAGSTVDAVLSIVAAGQDPATYAQGGNTPVTFLESKAADLAKTPGGAGKLLIAVAALGRDGKSFGGVNLVGTVNASYNGNTGQYGEDVIGHAFAILGLRAAGQAVPDKAIAFLDGKQTQEGGWAFSGDTAPGAADTNTTAVVVQAYVAAGANDRSRGQVLRNAWQYLMSQQGSDGGFPYQKEGEFGGESDVNSTSYVAQALLALGGTEDARRPVQYLLSMQKANGAFQWKASEADDNAGATYQAVPVLVGVTLVPSTASGGISGPETGVQPGMPRTGSGDNFSLAAIAALAAVLLGVGIVGMTTQRRAT